MLRKVLFYSGLIGFLVGIFWKADWQWSIEVAQVIAGVVHVPENNPIMIFARHLYAPVLIWPQVLLLKAGFSSWFISVFYSGLQSSVSFIAVSAMLLLFSGNAIFSIVMPFIFAGFTNALFSGHYYAAFFPTDLNNGGIFAFYTSILFFALFGLGRLPAALFLLGLLPMMHPSIGLSVWIGVFGYYVLSDHTKKKILFANVRWFLFGVGILIATLIVQFLFIGSFLSIPTAGEKKFLEYFVSYIDGHRRPMLQHYSWVDRVEFFVPELYVFATVSLFFRRYRKYISVASIEPLKILLILSTCALGITLWQEVWPTSVPLALKTLMITRWLNLDSVILPLFALGTIAKNNMFGVLMCVIGVYFLGIFGSIVWLPFFMFLIFSMEYKKRGWHTQLPRIGVYKDTIMTLVLLIFCVLTVYKVGLTGFEKNRYVHASDKALIEKIASGKKLFIVDRDSFILPQGMTGRGVVFNTYWIDTLAYAPYAGDEVETIVRDIYGISLYDKGIWPNFPALQTIWEKRTSQQWVDIGLRYGATEVLTPSSWMLALPKAFESQAYTLYTIGNHE